jgi:hypothetical protein
VDELDELELSEVDELDELELSEVDESEVLALDSLPTAHATSTVPARPVAARATVIPPTLRSPDSRAFTSRPMT